MVYEDRKQNCKNSMFKELYRKKIMNLITKNMNLLLNCRIFLKNYGDV